MLQNGVIRFPPHRKEERVDKKVDLNFLFPLFVSGVRFSFGFCLVCHWKPLTVDAEVGCWVTVSLLGPVPIPSKFFILSPLTK